MIKKKKKNQNTETYALSQHICMSAHKARRIIDQIRGRSYEETLMILELIPYRACYPVFKLIYSAAANANHNMGFNKAALVISEAEVNEGSTFKKLKPQARGRSYSIKKPTCHITIVLKALYEEYIVWLKKPGWIYKKKYINMRCHHMYRSENVWDKK